MPFVAEVARATRDLTTFTGTFTVPVLASVPVGSTIILAVNTDGATAGASYSATDSNGNTWVQRSLSVCATPNNSQLGILTCQVTSALNTSNSISVVATGRSPAHWEVLAHSFDDLGSGFDMQVINTQTVTSAVSVGPSGTAAQNAELLYAAWGYTNTVTFAAGSGFTAPAGGPAQVTVNAQRSLGVEWQYVSSSGTRSANAVLGSAQASASALVVMKQAGSNTAPTANAGPDQTTVEPYATVTLDGRGSVDPDGTIASYAWTQTSGPAVTLTGPTTNQPTFVAPAGVAASTLVFSLVVIDNQGASSAADTVSITVFAHTVFRVDAGGLTPVKVSRL